MTPENDSSALGDMAGVVERQEISLADLVIQVLDAQKKYFKTKDREDLIASKTLEKILRERAMKERGVQ